MITHGTPPVAEGGWSEFIKDFGIGFLVGSSEQSAKCRVASVLRGVVGKGWLRLILLVLARNVSQHGVDGKNEAETPKI
jgi:hypothetical protein